MNQLGVIEYRKPDEHDWMYNDFELDTLNDFANRCYKASKLAILDLYIDSANSIYNVSFPEFVLLLSRKKKQPEACQFTLVKDPSDNLFWDEVKRCLHNTRKNKKWIDEFPTFVDGAFEQLANSNPKE